ncbi:hypothetical protein Csal_3185 [Chromohalobacter israelensis DSM 3043]|uniref:Uncharacterized protein n=1 Tax=Chromohalobacter israelensis (strain ATCC BAA-138 / DSM 3043 / CIP 106854 / NCIMB 13768 / 1H11) TaxID=290398 RepID=Q1QSM9_CHRI1|nr:hypothetical protein Csal_3185 [Chromohalobacter salexigens DSM 3043]
MPLFPGCRTADMWPLSRSRTCVDRALGDRGDLRVRLLETLALLEPAARETAEFDVRPESIAGEGSGGARWLAGLSLALRFLIAVLACAHAPSTILLSCCHSIPTTVAHHRALILRDT